ncbi:MAG: transposase [bacterium]
MSLDLARLPRRVVHNARLILDRPDGVVQVDPDHFDVASLRTPGRRVQVYRSGDQWRCRTDPKFNQDHPCSHILAVLIQEGLVAVEGVAVFRKSDTARDHGLEARAWQLVPTLLPEYLGRLLRSGLPVIEAPRQRRRGRPFKATHALVYQSVMRVAERGNLNHNQGNMQRPGHVEHNPYGACGRSTISRFLAHPDTHVILEKLALLTLWPVRSYESLIHPDGTGLTTQHFTAFFEEKHHRRSERREHAWLFTEILWTYRFTMIAGIHSQAGPFGEAPWLLPLLERALLMLDVKEVGGDKAYQAAYIFEYLQRRGIDAQVKLKRNANPDHYERNRAFKRVVNAARLDPAAYVAKANRRSNAEAGNHAFKAFLGDQVYSRDPEARRNEVLCMVIAHNLARLVYLAEREGVEIDFTGGVEILAKAAWRELDGLYASMTVKTSKSRRLAT